MKNFIPFSVLALLLIFTSCSKEELFIEESISVAPIEAMTETMHQAVIVSDFEEKEEFSVVNELQVSKVSYAQISGELLIDFSTDFDFSSSVLEDVQHMIFIDGVGNESTIDFGVNNYTYDNGALSVAFAVAGNNLSGLELAMIQNIIILDEVVE